MAKGKRTHINSKRMPYTRNQKDFISIVYDMIAVILPELLATSIGTKSAWAWHNVNPSIINILERGATVRSLSSLWI